MQSTTAILLFSRTAQAEAHAKSFGRRGERVAGALLRRTQGVLRRSGLPVFHVDEREQHGATFGERLGAAAGAVLMRGYRQLIVVGNDCPTLTTTDIRRAAKSLEAGQPVIGRDGRGGAYLIGLSAEQCQPGKLAQLSWCTDRLAADLESFLGPSARHLRPRQDVNTLADLERRWQSLKKLLWQLADLFAEWTAPQHEVRLYARKTVRKRAERGPPETR